MMTALFTSAYVLEAATAQSNSTYVGWTKGPDGRGTWAILVGCVSTLLICTVTALHLNVPNSCFSWKKRVMYNIFDHCWAFLAPESIVLVACIQWLEARALAKRMQSLQGSNIVGNDTNPPIPREKSDLLGHWTLLHSFFVVMGGYQFRAEDTPYKNEELFYDIPDDPFTEKRPWSVLTSAGLVNLIESGHKASIPVVRIEDINNQSKSDVLGKSLSVLQISSLLFTVIARGCQKLAVSQLEVMTLIHVIFTLFMYAFWLHKPLGISEPTFIDSQDLKAWLLVNAELEEESKSWLRKYFRISTQPLDYHEIPEIRQMRDIGQAEAFKLRSTHTIADEQSYNLGISESSGSRGTAYVLRLGTTVTMTRSEVELLLVAHAPLASAPPIVTQTTDDAEAQAEAGDALEITLQVDQLKLDHLLQVWQLPNREQLLAPLRDPVTGSDQPALKHRTSNFASVMFMSMPMDPSLSFAVVSQIMTAIFAGISVSLWNYQFPTDTERMLWRCSTMTLLAQCAFFLLCIGQALLIRAIYGKQARYLTIRQIMNSRVGVSRPEPTGGSFSKKDTTDVPTLLIVFVSMLTGCLGYAAMAAKMYLYMEAFISLRKQPSSVYQTPDIARFMPHI